MNLLQFFGIAPIPSNGRQPNQGTRPLIARTNRPRGLGTDLIAVVGFNEKAFPISLPSQPWGDKLIARVASLPARMGGGGTNIAAALRLALDMSRRCPKGARRRIFLLSDGEHNVNTHDTEPAAQAIANAFINLNVIAFGEAANSALLRRLAGKTHNGKFIPVSNLHQMAAALRHGSSFVRTKRQHRQEVAIICVDLSPSMSTRDMGGQTRIEAVRDAVRSLITYKAGVWS
jgi:Mg-chelatase subunit ChlD